MLEETSWTLKRNWRVSKFYGERYCVDDLTVKDGYLDWVDNEILNIKRCQCSDDYDISYGNVLCVKKVLDLDPQDSPENLGNEGDNSDGNLVHDEKP